MSAIIRIDVTGGTDIKDAYYDCEGVSDRLGGISVETVFNGVNMLYCHQPVEEWIEEYHTEFFVKQRKETNSEL